MQFIKVYYIEFPIRIRGFPNEIRASDTADHQKVQNR